MKLSFFLTALVVICIGGVNAQFGVAITKLAQFASTLTSVVPYLKDPVDQPMKFVSAKDEGKIHLITVTPGHHNMYINFMLDGSNDELILPLTVAGQITKEQSLRQMETHLQTLDTKDKYTSTYFVPKGLTYYSGTCNRKFVKFCDFTYDMYISIGQSEGWGWNEGELRKQAKQYIDTAKSCSYERRCPAN